MEATKGAAYVGGTGNMLQIERVVQTLKKPGTMTMKNDTAPGREPSQPMMIKGNR